jgi:hypothetical protein
MSHIVEFFDNEKHRLAIVKTNAATFSEGRYIKIADKVYQIQKVTDIIEKSPRALFSKFTRTHIIVDG